MNTVADRLDELLERGGRRRSILTPEGVPLEVRVPRHSERLCALGLDLIFLGAAMLALTLVFLAGLVFFVRGFQLRGAAVFMAVFMFLGFLLRNLYFLYFELAWRGRTPGKKICGLRVVNRRGGELKPAAVVARNLTREMEIFLPLTILAAAYGEVSWAKLALLGWVVGLASLPFWNRGRLRAGDLIAGTQVVAQPRRALLADLSLSPVPAAADGPAAYNFTPEQLSIYGVLELQVLEAFLRRPPGPETERMLAEAVEKISRKIGWPEKPPPAETRRFLTDFYTAERANLEQGQLFGQRKADQKAVLDSSPALRGVPAGPRRRPRLRPPGRGQKGGDRPT